MARCWKCAAFVATIAACSTGTDPSSVEVGDVRIAVMLEPAVVRLGEQFKVRVAMVNRGDQSAELLSGYSCPFFISIGRGGGNHSGFPETAFYCLASPRLYIVPPRDSLVFSGPVTANAPPGDYDTRIRFAMVPELPELIAKLTVLR